MNPWYKDYSQYLAELFPGIKVQKISIDAGFSCPNRDGTISKGGCAYCNVASFSPDYCRQNKSITGQIACGKEFFKRKYPLMKYLAYFQAYTGTHDDDIARLESMYREALADDEVVGLIIGTRPDCLPEKLLDKLAEINREKRVIIEIGAESSHDKTLSAINRGHDWEEVVSAVNRAASKGIHCGLHLIAGLPGENEGDILDTISKACCLPIKSLKLHQLQIIKNTEFAHRYSQEPTQFNLFTPERYMELCRKIIDLVPGDIAIERFVSSAPADMLIAPKWGIKNHVFTDRLHSLLRTFTDGRQGE